MRYKCRLEKPFYKGSEAIPLHEKTKGENTNEQK